jgi:tRNA(Ile)-lysidine synthase
VFTLTRLAANLEPLLATTLPSTAADHAQRLCLALSGGLDSTVLLVALARLRGEGRLQARLRAIHVDHGLHAESAEWSDASRRLAVAHDVEFETVRVSVPQGAGLSPEAAAREARYSALAARIEPGEVLLTAHHADDQLETILLQWLRGGGLRAVAGMAPISPFGASAWHGRPLLPFTRDELAQWAAEQEGLQWQDDPSNLDRRFDRNYLRLEVLPALRARWPGIAATTGRVAEFARDALDAEAACVRDDLPRVLAGSALDLAALQGLSETRQRAVLRAWLVGLGLPTPSARTLAGLRRDMAVAAGDRLPETRWPGVVVRRYRGRLYAASPSSYVQNASEDWAATAGAPHAWTATTSLQLQAGVGVGLSRARLPDRLAVRGRSGGEVFVPAGGSHRRPLRKWLQEHDVLPWRRENLPLLFAGDHLVAVADLGVAAEFAARADEPSWRLVWTGRGVVTVADALASKWPVHPPIR